MITIEREEPPDRRRIEALLDAAFGPQRQRKISYRYRRGVAALPGLCLVARDGAALVGTIRVWPIRIGVDGDGVLIGPVAVAASHRSQGIGGRLMRAVLGRAESERWPVAVLVGDPGYYQRFGFVAAGSVGIVMPNENPLRVQTLRLDRTQPCPMGAVSLWREVRRHAA